MCGILFGCLAAPAYAQETALPVDSAFSDALSRFERGAYVEAADRFELLCAMAPEHRRSSAACLMAAQAHFRAFRPARTVALLTEYPLRFPGSRYTGESMLLLGDAHTKLGRPRDAWIPYFAACAAATAERDRAEAQGRLDALAAAEEDIRVLETFVTREDAGACGALVLLGWTERHMSRGDTAAARAGLRSLDRLRLEAPERDRRDALRTRLDAAAGPFRLVLVLPAPFDDAEKNLVVREMRDGILAAIDINTRLGGARVFTEQIHTSSADSLQQVLRHLAADAHTIGVIGGVFSADAAIVARAAQASGLPCLVPAATAEHLAPENGTVYQLNTTFRTRGELLADYVARRNPRARVAVLAPLESFARPIAEAFIARARQLDLSVEIVSWYSSGTNDVRTQYKAVAARIAPSDSSAVLFLPVPTRELAAALLEGARAFGFRATLLGAGDWNHPSLFSGTTTEGMRVEFESDYAVMSGSIQFQSFKEAFGLRTGRPVTRHAVFGYDAARFLLNALVPGTDTRQETMRRMRRPYVGVRSPIDLSSGNSNRGLNIMTVSGGAIIRLTTIPEE